MHYDVFLYWVDFIIIIIIIHIILNFNLFLTLTFSNWTHFILKIVWVVN